ncbi:thiamine diphosphate-binding protein [Tribonema minus]|uniref:1-deoxy-D-xylulose-5-phosphate synthase n=1 Tax=Tribonema minus TaxID=303371 RepID=A0A835ZBE2_9STRA|nr:thiamine diphosphate-binding protein [Tribonema minus]
MGRRRNNCIAVIGDGAITGGMAFEAMNTAGYLNQRSLVILNDNGQVSLPTGTHSAGGIVPAGALSSYTGRLLSSKPFKNVRDVAKTLNKLLPGSIQNVNKKIDEYARGMVSGGTLFEELGYYYVGPVDGHDLDNLVPILQNIRDMPDDKPVLLHVKTEKGMGYPPAMAASDKYHGVSKFDVATGRQQKGPPAIAPSLTTIFANTLIDIASEDRTVVGITAAMPGGTGMDIFGRRFPKRTYDVGIAEQHAVTFAAGMAIEGLKPFCCIYSTFMQRAYDQVMHDVVIQKLPVRMILDRAGLVGNDGPTHHGSYDLAYLGTLPDIVIMAPSDEIELMNMIQTAYEYDAGPSVVRYPRGSGYGMAVLNNVLDAGLDVMPTRGVGLQIGKGRIVREARAGAKQKAAILSIGARLIPACQAAAKLERENPDLGVTVADARFMKPLDVELIRDLARRHSVLVTVEEGAVGGFGDHVLHFMALDGLLDDGKCKVRPMVLPDNFIEAGTQTEQYDVAGLSEGHIEATVLRLMDKATLPVAAASVPAYQQ